MSKIFTQIIFWLIIAGISIGFTAKEFQFAESLIIASFNLVFLGIVFYSNIIYTFPRYYEPNNNTKYYIINITLLIFIALISAYFEFYLRNTILHPQDFHPPGININNFHPPEISNDDFHHPRKMKLPLIVIFVRSLFWNLLMILISTVYKVQTQLKQNSEATKLITEEKLKTELQLLKAQINPHFLFNALNNIYSLCYMKSESAPDSVLKLSNMLRYVIDDCKYESVQLNSEIEYIHNFIAFHKLKVPEKLNITFSHPESVGNYKLAPLLFIPFIENSFKYSKIDELKNAYIVIDIQLSNSNELNFKIENSVPITGKPKAGSGTGISNVKKRLNIIYKNNFELYIDKKENCFNVSLKIHLQ